MKTTKRIHVAYIVTILALLSLGATYAARTMLDEIASPANINGFSPEIRLLDSDVADPDWEIESASDGFLEISPDGSTNGDGMFKIHEDADADLLTLDANGNIAINGELAQTFNEVEVYGNIANDTFAAVAVTPDEGGAGARFSVSTASAAVRIAVDNDGTGYSNPFSIDLSAPNNALSIDSGGDVGIGVSEDNVAAGFALHVASGGDVLLDTTGTTGDWELNTDAAAGMRFRNQSTSSVTFQNGAPADSLVVDGSGNIGNGTPIPDTALHVFRDDGTAAFKVEETSGTVATRKMMELVNNGAALLTLENTDINKRWNLATNGNGHFVFTLSGTGGDEMRLSKVGEFSTGPGGFKALNSKPNGDLIIQGALTENSDREKKENFQAVDCDDVLAKVVDMEITTWNYKSNEETIRHMGPMAQDFHKAFALGRDDKTITAMDKDGVALASIKALKKELDAKQARIENLETKLSKNVQRLEAMEQMLRELTRR